MCMFYICQSVNEQNNSIHVVGSYNVMNISEFDKIILLQLVVARLGESIRMNWWNVDATDADGGGSLFGRLLNKTGVLAGAEAILQAAELTEQNIVRDSKLHNPTCTLFMLPYDLKNKLHERWMQFKRHPDTIPDIIIHVINPDMVINISEFQKGIESNSPSEIKYENTPLGREISGKIPQKDLDIIYSLIGAMMPFEKNKYKMSYYR